MMIDYGALADWARSGGTALARHIDDAPASHAGVDAQALSEVARDGAKKMRRRA